MTTTATLPPVVPAPSHPPAADGGLLSLALGLVAGYTLTRNHLRKVKRRMIWKSIHQRIRKVLSRKSNGGAAIIVLLLGVGGFFLLKLIGLSGVVAFCVMLLFCASLGYLLDA